MSTPAVLPQPGSQVTIGKRSYTVIRHGCATRWPECPHGDHAVTVLQDGHLGTQCRDWRMM